MALILVSTPGEDEAPVIEVFKNQGNLNDKVKELNGRAGGLHFSDYAVFVGEVVKNFDQHS